MDGSQVGVDFSYDENEDGDPEKGTQEVSMATQRPPQPAWSSSSSNRIGTASASRRQRPVWDYIPEEIQVKILKNLPVSTLLRSRCVCKLWKQVIDSETFVQEHLALQKDSYTIIEYEAPEYLVVDPCKLPAFEVIPFPTPERLHVLGTLHGIICLYDDIFRKVVLWNPCIRKMMIVGPTTPGFSWYPYAEYGFFRGPSSGFWIDPLTKEFKIIMFELGEYEEEGEMYDEYDNCRMYSYSSTQRDWKKIPSNEKLEFSSCYTDESTTAVVIDNVGHWTVYYNYTDNKGHEMRGIRVLLFDFNKEEFLEPILAISIKKEWNRPVVCIRDGALSLVYMRPQNYSYEVFVRKEGKWVKVDTFCISPILERFIWPEGDTEDRERKTRVVAAITGGRLSNECDNVCRPLMMTIREAKEIVTVNGLVASLLFPAAECLEADSTWIPRI